MRNMCIANLYMFKTSKPDLQSSIRYTAHRYVDKARLNCSSQLHDIMHNPSMKSWSLVQVIQSGHMTSILRHMFPHASHIIFPASHVIFMQVIWYELEKKNLTSDANGSICSTLLISSCMPVSSTPGRPSLEEEEAITSVMNHLTWVQFHWREVQTCGYMTEWWLV